MSPRDRGLEPMVLHLPVGPSTTDLALIAGGMVVAMVLLGASLFVWKDIGDLDEVTKTSQAKSAICKKAALPDDKASVGDKHAGGQTGGQTKFLTAGAEPPLLVELRSITKGGASYVQLGSSDVLPPRAVTIVNLWATWCGPCVNELPGLKRLFDAQQPTWGDKVRFLPIMTEDQTSTDAALRDIAPKMPPHKHFLVEMGDFTQPLERVGLWSDKLPVTLVVGCRQKVRWAHFGELLPADMDAMKGVVDGLIDKLDGPECRAPIACGDGNCNGLENKVTCAADCAQDVVICGDHVCDEGEASECPKDCQCGNGKCDAGESYRTCSKDCRKMCPRDMSCPAPYSCEKNGYCMDTLTGALWP